MKQQQQCCFFRFFGKCSRIISNVLLVRLFCFNCKKWSGCVLMPSFQQTSEGTQSRIQHSRNKRNASDPASNSQYTNINDHHARHEVVLDDSVSSV